MKAMFKYLPVLLFIGAIACKKVENKVYLTGGTPPNLTISTPTVRLEPGDEDKLAIRFNWTNPNFALNTGSSSHDVSYTFELDTLGGNFNSSNKYSTLISKDFTLSFTVAELNGILVNTMKLRVRPTRRVYTMEARVIATIGIGGRQISNKVSFTLSPFPAPPKVTPPSTNRLFITGEATPLNWMSGNGDTSLAYLQEFKRVADTLYVLDSFRLVADKEFLFVPRYNNWSAVAPDPEKYGTVKATNNMNPLGDEFQRFGNNHKAPSITGFYRIEVNFQSGRTTLTLK